MYLYFAHGVLSLAAGRVAPARTLLYDTLSRKTSTGICKQRPRRLWAFVHQ